MAKSPTHRWSHGSTLLTTGPPCHQTSLLKSSNHTLRDLPTIFHSLPASHSTYTLHADIIPPGGRWYNSPPTWIQPRSLLRTPYSVFRTLAHLSTYHHTSRHSPVLAFQCFIHHLAPRYPNLPTINRPLSSIWRADYSFLC